jgi:hypothetical protein
LRSINTSSELEQLNFHYPYRLCFTMKHLPHPLSRLPAKRHFATLDTYLYRDVLDENSATLNFEDL